MRTAIVDYGSGNLHSAGKAFEHVAEPKDRISVTDDVAAIAAADRVVLPGVGTFADCRAGLMAMGGLYDALIATVVEKGRPFLGICVGMQLMAAIGEEHGSHEGFGWIPGRVTRIRPADPALKVPHMGWNALNSTADHPLLDGIGPGVYCYFAHSYHLVPDDPAQCLSTVGYGKTLTAIVGRGSMVGTQFHPEKSQTVGLRLIANFLRWRP